MKEFGVEENLRNYLRDFSVDSVYFGLGRVTKKEHIVFGPIVPKILHSAAEIFPEWNILLQVLIYATHSRPLSSFDRNLACSSCVPDVSSTLLYRGGRRKSNMSSI